LNASNGADAAEKESHIADTWPASVAPSVAARSQTFFLRLSLSPSPIVNGNDAVVGLCVLSYGIMQSQCLKILGCFACGSSRNKFKADLKTAFSLAISAADVLDVGDTASQRGRAEHASICFPPPHRLSTPLRTNAHRRNNRTVGSQ
jgi:hypothetical protein